MQIKEHIHIGRHKTACIMVAARLVDLVQPCQMVVTDDAVLPVHTGTETKLRRDPLTQSRIDAKRLSVRKHMAEITSIRIDQRHAKTCLDKPVVPKIVRHDSIFVMLSLFLCLMELVVTQIQLHTQNEVKIAITAGTFSRIKPNALEHI